MSSWPDNRNDPGRGIAGQPIPVFFSTLLDESNAMEGSTR